MSHPYTDFYGYPISHAEVLRRMRGKRRRLYTGPQVGGVNTPITVHEAVRLAGPINKEDDHG